MLWIMILRYWGKADYKTFITYFWVLSHTIMFCLLSSKQRDLYDETFRDLVQAVLDGFNGTIFAYGQTGTGKTYTMQGNNDFLYKCLRLLFNLLRIIDIICWESLIHMLLLEKRSPVLKVCYVKSCIHCMIIDFTRTVNSFYYILWQLHGQSVIRHPQLRSGGFYWQSRVLLPTCPCCQ